MYAARTSALRQLLREKGSTAFLVTNPVNIFYLTGFSSLSPEEREGYVFVTSNHTHFFTDSRYLDEALKSSLTRSGITPHLITYDKRLTHHVSDMCVAEKIGSVGFEAENITVAEFEMVKACLEGVIVAPVHSLIEQLREVKDQQEVAAIEKACQVTDQCLEEFAQYISIGKTERELAYFLERWVKEKGHALAFDSIVAVDENSALPHYNTALGNGKVENGSIILVDFGVKINGYVSDITRMFFAGEIEPKVRKTYETLLTIQEETVRLIEKHTQLDEVDTECRKLFAKHGLPACPHSTGHGIGLQIHEEPRLSYARPAQKKDGQVCTVEPGVYYEGKWGMRIEDSVVIENGNAHILTKFPKTFRVV